MLKYTNTAKTTAQFNGASFSLAAPEDFSSIGDGPTREAVLKWIAAGNVPVPVPPPTQAEIDREISVAAKITLAKLRADIFPDVLNFLATLPGAPLSIKNAAVLATAEMAKVKP